MNIIAWNIHWQSKENNKKETVDEANERIRHNQNRAKVAEDVINKYNCEVIAMFEAGESGSPQIKGYDKYFCDRKYMYPMYKNGITLYIKNGYKYKICNEVLEEIKKNKIACFLPVIIDENNNSVHCLFVWTTVKNGENGKTAPYGYKRFREILTSGMFKKTLEFIDGNKNNVIIMGDFNMAYNWNEKNSDRIRHWNEIEKKLGSIGLAWMENNINTFNFVTNDHCFVSKTLAQNSVLTVGMNECGEVISDHNMINLRLKI